MKCHHAHIIYHILHSVLVAGDISRMSTSPPSQPKHTKGPLCFQVLMWKADGNRRYRQDQHIASDSSSVSSPDHDLFVRMKIHYHYAPIFQCGYHELMSCPLHLWNGHGVGSLWASSCQEDILLLSQFVTLDQVTDHVTGQVTCHRPFLSLSMFVYVCLHMFGHLTFSGNCI